jgi:hypothetical protein
MKFLSIALVLLTSSSASPLRPAPSPSSSDPRRYVSEPVVTPPPARRAALPPYLPGPTAAPLQPRCDNPPCGGDGPTSVLTAQVVTSTIVSTTSVPCYITTFVTNSVTTTSTVYSTDTITSTVTEKGTVYVIKYSPTPVLRSTVLQSVVQITQTYTSMWLESTGSAYEETKTGATETVGGGVGGGGGAVTQGPPVNTCTINGNQCPTAGGGGGGWGGKTPAAAGPPAPVQTQPANPKDAWTHTTAAAAGATAVAGGGVAVAPGASTIAGGTVVNWSAGQRLSSSTMLIILSFCLALGVVSL